MKKLKKRSNRNIRKRGLVEVNHDQCVFCKKIAEGKVRWVFGSIPLNADLKLAKRNVFFSWKWQSDLFPAEFSKESQYHEDVNLYLIDDVIDKNSFTLNFCSVKCMKNLLVQATKKFALEIYAKKKRYRQNVKALKARRTTN